MRNVYWIGGASGAGKSTIARRLAAEHRLIHYATDDVMAEHAGAVRARTARTFMNSRTWTWTSGG